MNEDTTSTSSSMSRNPNPLWDRFDWISFLSYSDLSNKPREDSFRWEMQRVGINAQAFPNIRTPFEARSIQGLNVRRAILMNPGYLNITMGHLRMVKTAWALGYQHGLFFENDARFLLDLDKVTEIVESLPEDYDLALFDWMFPKKHVDECRQELDSHELINGHWKRMTNVRSCACYAMSSRGMNHYMHLIERAAVNGSKLKICDQYWPNMKDSGLNCYCAFPNAAVQGVPGGSTDYNYMLAKYDEIGIKREDYAT